MEFRFTPEQDAFRERVKDFLKGALAAVADEERPANHSNWSPRFSKLMADAGWLTCAWPNEHGGQGLGFVEQMILGEEMSLAGAPIEFHRRAIFYSGPVLMRYGTAAQKQRFLPGIARGETSFCQLFSEPEAGSDLANLKSTAIRDGDVYVLNGQKIWTSGGHLQEYGILLARTDPAAPKHAGISMFFLPMKSPGVTVRPLVNMADAHHFNQVFFDNVVVSKEYLIGEENRGWTQTRTLLEFERSSIGANSGARRTLQQIRANFRRRWTPEMAGYDAVRAEIAELWIRSEVSRMLSYRTASLQAVGQDASPVAALVKLFSSELNQDINRLAVRVAGLTGQVRRGEGERRPDWAAGLLSTVASTIGGGTSEVQRNTIARRRLDLPAG